MNKICAQRQHFDAISSVYCTARQDEKHLLVKEEIWRYAFRLLREEYSISYARCLDAMCGAGDGLAALQAEAYFDFSYEAFDYSEKMVDAARCKHPNVKIFCADVCEYVADDAYDIIILFGGLHHVYADRSRAVHSLSQSLRSGGVLINFEPTNNSLLLRYIRSFIYKMSAIFDDDTERAFQTTELNSLMASVGLKPLLQFFPGLLAYVLWYNPDAFPMLNRGTPALARKLLCYETKIWGTAFARYCSFATFSCFLKE